MRKRLDAKHFVKVNVKNEILTEVITNDPLFIIPAGMVVKEHKHKKIKGEIKEK